jgi:hypothetical protein
MSAFDPHGMIDHLVYGVVDLQRSVTDIADQIGVTPTEGGRHIGRGTRNYLLGLSDSCYLEIIALDPDNPVAGGQHVPFGLDKLAADRLITWAIHPRDVDHALVAARRYGADHGKLHAMSRVDANGTELHWTLAVGDPLPLSGLAPFLIDWQDSPHPASTGLEQAELDDLRVTAPDPDKITALLRDMKLRITAEPGDEPALHADISGPKGTITL